jgi:polyisoprenoid-binding protein YceI
VTLKANPFNCYQNPMLKREVCGGDFETTIDRTQFGMVYGIDWGFPKDVRLVVRVEAVKQ